MTERVRPASVGAPVDVVVVGAAAVDDVHRLRWGELRTGAELPITPADRRQGGSAANIAAWLASGDVRARLLAVLGDDAEGRWLHDQLLARGVDVSGLLTLPGRRSPRAIILVDEVRGERTILPIRAPEYVSAAELPRPLLPGDGRCVYFDDVSIYTLDRQALGGALTVTGVVPRITSGTGGPVLPDVPADLVDIVIASQAVYEWGPDAFAAARAHFGPRLAWLVVTDGGRGARAYGTDQEHHVPATPVDHVVDSTGAGDAFAAGLLAGLLAGEAMPGALAKAAAWGARAVSASTSSTALTPPHPDTAPAGGGDDPA